MLRHLEKIISITSDAEEQYQLLLKLYRTAGVI